MQYAFDYFLFATTTTTTNPPQLVMRTAMANLLDGVEVEHVQLTLTDSSDRRRTTSRRQGSRRLGTSATAEFTIQVSEEEFGGDIDDLESAVDTVATDSTTLVAEMEETAEEKGSSTDFSAMTVTDVETVRVTRPPTSLPTTLPTTLPTSSQPTLLPSVAPASDEAGQTGLDSATLQLVAIIVVVGLVFLTAGGIYSCRLRGRRAHGKKYSTRDNDQEHRRNYGEGVGWGARIVDHVELSDIGDMYGGSSETTAKGVELEDTQDVYYDRNPLTRPGASAEPGVYGRVGGLR